MPNKKLICPKCGSDNAVRILYGMPIGEAIEASERGEIFLGGCYILPDSPMYTCNDCGYSWGKHGGFELISQIRSIKAYIGGFWGPNFNTEIDIKLGILKYCCTNYADHELCIELKKSISEDEKRKLIRELKNCDFE